MNLELTAEEAQAVVKKLGQVNTMTVTRAGDDPLLWEVRRRIHILLIDEARKELPPVPEAVIWVDCPMCRAPAGERCVFLSVPGTSVAGCHSSRWDALTYEREHPTVSP